MIMLYGNVSFGRSRNLSMPGDIYSCKAWKNRFAATWIMYNKKSNRKLAVASDYMAKDVGVCIGHRSFTTHCKLGGKSIL